MAPVLLFLSVIGQSQAQTSTQNVAAPSLLTPVISLPSMTHEAAGNTISPVKQGDATKTNAVENSAVQAAAPKHLIEVVQIKSFFFTAQEMLQINNALETSRKAGHSQLLNSSETIISGVVGSTGAVPGKTFTYPQFFLRSLVYNGSNNWSVQINDQKITPESEGSEALIKVLSVDKEKVKLEWKPVDMAKVNETWNKLPDQSINGQVIVDNANNTVGFTLHPNQTFSSFAMEVLEGKVEPVVVSSNNGEGKDASAAINSSIDIITPMPNPGMPIIPGAMPGPIIPGAPATTKPDDSLNGLLNKLK